VTSGYKLLLIEDDDVDIEMIKRILSKEGIRVPLVVARNGLEALAILQNVDSENYLRQPYIILLDLNMPVMDGHEFLTILRQDVKLRNSIVYILTTSDAHQDKAAAYQKQVAGYILKSPAHLNLNAFVSTLHSLCQIIEFPPN